ncbi:MAG: zinc-ribbon domain-containing protein [Bacilli bacterium]|nr:zinc-ribbon domain-containing protein [Bacilli bacterium]
MKCSKCGNIVNENDSFCTNCGEKINREVLTKQKPETNKKIIFIFVAEIILVILVALGVNGYYSKHFGDKYATQNEFKDLMNSKNYNLEDSTQSYDSKSIKSYDFATNGKDLGIHYIIADGNQNADKVFNNLYRQIESQKQSGFLYTSSVELIDYSYYSLENNGNYYVVAKNDNTVFAVSGVSKYKDEINAMVKDLGFGYPSNIVYIIFGIVILVLIIIYVVMWKIFVKAGVKGWKSLIPLYNCYCLSKIAFNKGWLFILMLITPINLVFIPITCYKLAKAFGKSTGFAVCSIFFPFVTMQIIAFDNSRYIENN